MGGGLGRGGGEEREFGLAGKLADGALSFGFRSLRKCINITTTYSRMLLTQNARVRDFCFPCFPYIMQTQGRIVELDAADL